VVETDAEEGLVGLGMVAVKDEVVAWWFAWYEVGKFEECECSNGSADMCG